MKAYTYSLFESTSYIHIDETTFCRYRWKLKVIARFDILNKLIKHQEGVTHVTITTEIIHPLFEKYAVNLTGFKWYICHWLCPLSPSCTYEKYIRVSDTVFWSTQIIELSTGGNLINWLYGFCRRSLPVC